jgi:hypothetical protein
LLVYRQLVAVAIDVVAHVVALERHRERGERTITEVHHEKASTSRYTSVAAS